MAIDFKGNDITLKICTHCALSTNLSRSLACSRQLIHSTHILVYCGQRKIKEYFALKLWKRYAQPTLFLALTYLNSNNIYLSHIALASRFQNISQRQSAVLSALGNIIALWKPKQREVKCFIKSHPKYKGLKERVIKSGTQMVWREGQNRTNAARRKEVLKEHKTLVKWKKDKDKCREKDHI